MRIASLYDYITLIEEWDQFFDKIINRLSGLDHQHHLPGQTEIADKLLKRIGGNYLFSLTPSVYKIGHFVGVPVKHCNGETPAFYVEHKILTHHGEAYKSYISFHIIIELLSYKMFCFILNPSPVSI